MRIVFRDNDSLELLETWDDAPAYGGIDFHVPRRGDSVLLKERFKKKRQFDVNCVVWDRNEVTCYVE